MNHNEGHLVNGEGKMFQNWNEKEREREPLLKQYLTRSDMCSFNWDKSDSTDLIHLAQARVKFGSLGRRGRKLWEVLL